MKRIVSVTTLVVLLLTAASAGAATCNTRVALEEWLAFKYKNAKDLQVLAFDHDTDAWTAWKWNNNQLSPSDVEVPHTNDPTVVVTKHSDFAIVVVSTNPLVYSARQTASKEEAIEDLAAIQELAGLLANFATSGLGVIGTRRAADAAAAEGIPQAISSNVAASELWMSDRALEELPSTTTRTATLKEHADVILTRLTALVHPLEERVTAAGKASQTVKARLDEIDAAWDNTFAAVQRIEHRRGTTDDLLPATLKTLPDGLVAAYSGFRTRRTELASHEAPCVAGLTSLEEAVTLAINTDFGSRGAVTAAVNRLREIAEALAAAELRKSCSDPELIKAIEGVATWLDTHPPKFNTPLETEAAEILAELEDGLGKYLTVAASRTKILTEGAKLLADQSAPTQRAGRLASLALLQDEVFPTNASCLVQRGVIEIHRPQGHEHDLAWSKLRTEEFTVAPRASVKDSVVRERPDEVKRTYHLARRLPFAFDVTTAVVYTDIVDPEFGTSPRSVPKLDASGNPMTDIDGQPLFKTVHVPVRKSEKTRAGKLAMLLSFGPEAWRPFAAEVGFGVDADTPSFFTGLSYGLGSIVKISVGRTWQQVTRLPDGVTTDTELGSADDLQTVNGYDNDWYGALSIALDELPIFKPKK